MQDKNRGPDEDLGSFTNNRMRDGEEGWANGRFPQTGEDLWEDASEDLGGCGVMIFTSANRSARVPKRSTWPREDAAVDAGEFGRLSLFSPTFQESSAFAFLQGRVGLGEILDD